MPLYHSQTPPQTVSSLHSFFLAMTIYQDVQRRARAELDAVVGPDRLPTLEDRPNLPYLNALVTEVLRWIPVGPLGKPAASFSALSPSHRVPQPSRTA